MKAIKSRYMTSPKTWDERITAMRQDLKDEEYTYLFFKVAINLNDAKDNADYDRYAILCRMAKWVKHGKKDVLEAQLDELENVR